MANLTLTLDDDVLRRARRRALEQGTSVNAIVREQLTRFAGAEADTALASFLAFSEESTASSGAKGRTWRRDELYDR